MRPTCDYILQCISDINRQCFGGELPPLPVVLSNAARRLGVLSYVKKRGLLGRSQNTGFKMTISTRFDLPEQDVRDTICHEMIHYYIAWKNIRDTSSHGDAFRSIMKRINEQHGYHITISQRLTDEQLMSAPRTKQYLVCHTLFADGRHGITVAARTRLFTLWDQIPRLPGVVRAEWFSTLNPYFGKFRASQRPAAYIIKADEVLPQLSDAKPLVRQGNTIYVGKPGQPT